MLREFKDEKGTDWLVWDVYPTNDGDRMADAPSVFPHREFSDGWLCFESKYEKRRVTPVPVGWEEFSEARLSELCASAGYASAAGSRASVRASREMQSVRDADGEARR